MHFPVFARLVALLVAAVLAASCGIEPQAVRTGGTGSPRSAVASGTITGLGGIVVNGVRFDESGATVTINGAANRPVSDLALGMVVEVRGEVDVATRTGRAATVVATALLSGPIAAVDAAAGEITVLGQRVEVFADTALQGASSLSSVRSGDPVIVYGFWDYFAGHVDATRLEIVPGAAGGQATIIGKVSETNGTRFKIGALVVEAAGAAITGLETGIATGRYVEVLGVLDAAGILRATSVASRLEFDPVEGALTEIEGYVTDFEGVARFRVLGLPVNGAGAQLSGVAANLANGALVEVEGRVEQGVLVAARIDVRAGALQPSAPVPVTLQGAISDFVSASSFRVNGQAVDAGAAAFTGGTAGELANGRNVQVTGVVAGDVLRASAVLFVAPVVAEGTRYAVDGAIEAFVSPASFRVNGQVISATAGTGYSGGSVADLANGRRVHVDGLLAGGILTAWTISFQPIEVVTTVALSGVVSDFISPASFRVNNQAITADSLTTYEDGSASSLANGRRVDVTGRLSGGVVTATRIVFREPPESGENAEVEGRITDFVSVSNFRVQGQLIDASAATYSHGGPATLANGLKVHVKGPITAGVLKAKTVEIDN